MKRKTSDLFIRALASNRQTKAIAFVDFSFVILLLLLVFFNSSNKHPKYLED